MGARVLASGHHQQRQANARNFGVRDRSSCSHGHTGPCRRGFGRRVHVRVLGAAFLWNSPLHRAWPPAFRPMVAPPLRKSGGLLGLGSTDSLRRELWLVHHSGRTFSHSRARICALYSDAVCIVHRSGWARHSRQFAWLACVQHRLLVGRLFSRKPHWHNGCSHGAYSPAHSCQ